MTRNVKAVIKILNLLQLYVILSSNFSKLDPEFQKLRNGQQNITFSTT